MLDNFIFSINTVAPLFLVLFLGLILKKKGFLSESFVSVGNKVVFYIALPASIFLSVYTAELGDLLDWGFVAFAVGASLVGFFGIWFISAIFIKNKPILGAFAQGAFRGNFAFLGMPLLINLAGEAGEARAALIMAFVLPVYNICTVLILAACSDSAKKVGFKTIILTIVKNPFIIAIAIAFGFQLLNIRLPFIISTTVRYGANMATPLALICLGAGMTFQGFDAKFKYALGASLIKVLVLPVIFVIVGYLMGFRNYDIAAFLILGGIPSAIAGYAMVVQMGGDGYIAGTIVVISTLFSAFTLTIFIYILRTIGWLL
ncbi:MAG: AEC family transporter [Defluviitaleaceae bacterium]|nr:AEC family transporter [Defluviitaleaceae bacterium]